MGEDGLNDTGRRLIAGYLSAARALSAFGNTVPTSYLRFAEGDESPEDICWGMKDRTGLVRVPLAWGGACWPAWPSRPKRGFSDPESLELAEWLSTHKHDDFESLPTSRQEAADALEAEREIFEAEGVFPAALIDTLLAGLRDAGDTSHGEEDAPDEAAREEQIRRYWHVG